jgi:hypothetical protein
MGSISDNGSPIVIALRQRLTKIQWFILFNCVCLVASYFSGTLHLTVDWFVPDALAFAAINVVALISARKYKDWKK